jgi:hypothetical protein
MARRNFFMPIFLKKPNDGFARFSICQSPLSLHQIATRKKLIATSIPKRANLSKIFGQGRPTFRRRGLPICARAAASDGVPSRTQTRSVFSLERKNCGG